ncbi:hypothetical protein [Streptomyces sp. ME02-8801-2C]|uniref:hypothetical protein n=1 Tax=Streptomyces sp. ME02-8801-2C TaxID=3028680 RepID=UPI0029C0780E|nr:hypothetical protein [Streptomyces sp. ME02-8801-2C]
MGCLVLPPEAAAEAKTMTISPVFAVPRAVLAPPVITVPATGSLGAVQAGQTGIVKLGSVKVTSSNNRTWVATVSVTSFKTGGGSPSETITPGNVSYWSGPVVSKSGPGTPVPGQATASNRVPLSASRTAFSYSTQLAVTSSVTWQPTLNVSVPATSVAGTYSGTLTHSVA